MKKILHLLSLLLIGGGLLASCVTNRSINTVEGGKLPILMVCPAPGQDFDSLFTPPVTITEAEESYIEVQTNIEGATLYINNQEMGEDPIKVIKIPSGAYIVDIKKEGYEDFNTMINVNKEKGYTFSFKLEKISE